MEKQDHVVGAMLTHSRNESLPQSQQQQQKRQKQQQQQQQQQDYYRHSNSKAKDRHFTLDFRQEYIQQHEDPHFLPGFHKRMMGGRKKYTSNPNKMMTMGKAVSFAITSAQEQALHQKEQELQVLKEKAQQRLSNQVQALMGMGTQRRRKRMLRGAMQR
eukprot:CAMPEP_0198141912 /NCGR_PEP_ID=MMETSP1443-20131203/4836_1 /TAXON_ID=186043 /ORGANISM="Entomoneis sp., Strain CCMP2396" /LENGTH=158 /DNA_ID=CAMNT_0043804799 /DNA_START=218 /DNA_END=694 /DNA_ORIENTATION=-